MGVDIAIIDEKGNIIERFGDKNHSMNKYWDLIKNNKYNCIKYIDEYGDTIFNILQFNQLILDCKLLLKEVSEQKTKDYIKQIIKFTKKAEKNSYYIKFIGD